MTAATPDRATPSATDLTPTGTRLVLRRETASGAVSAEVGTVAAVLCDLVVDGTRIVEHVPRASSSPWATGIILAPWPNRIRDGKWTLDGVELSLDLTERERGNAIHGLLRNTDYRVVDRTANHVTLAALIAPQHGWPFLVGTSVTYQLTDDGLTVTHTAINLSERSAPYAVGAHPYLRVGDTPIDELTLTVWATQRIDTDERLNPIGTTAIAGTADDLSGGRRVGDLQLDTAFGGVSAPDDSGVVASVAAPSGERVDVIQDPAWTYLQVFTANAYPDQESGLPRRALAIEPMTAPPDAFNSGDGLVWLAPGERWSGSWGIRRVSA